MELIVHLHADFSKRVVVNSEILPWEDSPMKGVQRRKLDRIGDEVARATSLVKYDPQSYFSPHTHDGGEEIFVVDGVFSDEHGDYPAGTYIRNPIGTRHKPHSDNGCIIFVKLHQFDKDDAKQFTIDTLTDDFQDTDIAGMTVLPLHSFGTENCGLVRLAADTETEIGEDIGGKEILVLEGTVSDKNGHYPKGTWLRIPHGTVHQFFSSDGCLFYQKTGHLPQK